MTQKIVKYIQGTASITEQKEVENWIHASKENTQKFHRLKAECITASFDQTQATTNTYKELNTFKKNIHQRQAQLWKTPLKYAALLVCLIASSIYLANNTNLFEQDPVAPKISKNSITIKLNNGNIRVVKENENIDVKDSKGNKVGVQKGNKICYKKNSTKQKLIYNTLTVPYGKQFDVVLSDNTHVYLNAGTTLKYPVNFIKGKKRNVFLSGEALFDVSKDSLHPFVVHIDDLNIRVLGTKFNVSAYPEDLSAKTVLVEGAVALYQEKKYQAQKATMLTPGRLASLNKLDKNISLEKVDVSIYTAWTKGNILFRHEPFKNILKKLERQFDVTIVNNNEKLNDVLFTASFDNESLDYILKTFHTNFGINYTLNQKQITINP
ncbi:FecR family protein [Flavicella sediminum]|uniref:FecR family protein n=1 Tax=Flavicella sediminum TaxID=2585141 RepID=UPI00111CDEC9|nr:FecR family protein [Flavicella sediminum]